LSHEQQLAFSTVPAHTVDTPANQRIRCPAASTTTRGTTVNRKPIGISVPYRKPQPEATLAALEKAVKDLTQRVQQLELKSKEKSK